MEVEREQSVEELSYSRIFFPSERLQQRGRWQGISNPLRMLPR